jgi:hypothetical protein
VHYGDLICILDDAGAAGADPEGDVRTIGDNTTDALYLDPHEVDFSAAPAAGDTGVVKRIWRGRDAENDDGSDSGAKAVMLGILRADITTDYYGLVLVWGLCDFAKVKAALTAGNPVVSDAAIVGDGDGDEVKLQFGYCHAASHAGEAGVGGLLFIDILNCVGLEEA